MKAAVVSLVVARPVEFVVPFSDTPCAAESRPLPYCAVCTRATPADAQERRTAAAGGPS